MAFLRRNLAGLLVGALAVGGIAYAGARAAGPNESSERVELAQAESSPPAERRKAEGKQGPRAFLKGGLRRAVRGELVVRGREEGQFVTVRFDRGLLQRVDGSTIVLREDDGTIVSIPTNDQTAIRRDGRQAELRDLKAGDHVSALRVKEGDAFSTKLVRAISPERFAERQERRADRKTRRADRKSRGAPAA